MIIQHDEMLTPSVHNKTFTATLSQAAVIELELDLLKKRRKRKNKNYTRIIFPQRPSKAFSGKGETSPKPSLFSTPQMEKVSQISDVSPGHTGWVTKHLIKLLSRDATISILSSQIPQLGRWQTTFTADSRWCFEVGADVDRSLDTWEA